MAAIFMNRAVVGYGLALMSVTACNTATDAQSSPTESHRYQFEKDPQGRLVRLDTITGEVTLAEPRSTTTPQPNAALQPTNKSTPARTIPRPAVPRVTVAQQRRDSDDAAKATTVAGSSTRSECPTSGPAIVQSERLDILVDAQAESPPMTSLPRGTELFILETNGDWRLVRFSDPAWGQRAGYIRCSQTPDRSSPGAGAER